MKKATPDYESHVARKEEARKFLATLEGFLKEKIGPSSEVKAAIDDIARRAKASTTERHLAFPEGAFLNHYAAPLIHEFLVNRLNLTKESARIALLSESYRHQPKFASNSPASKERHPFTKSVGEDLDSIVTRWWKDGEGSAICQSCPDLAIGLPCPYKVVFEGKYFRHGSSAFAKHELIRDIYQCFFYLGLPRVPATGRHAAWEYDYACLLAYDASGGNLKIAWQGIKDEVKMGMWKGANIYVIVL